MSLEDLDNKEVNARLRIALAEYAKVLVFCSYAHPKHELKIVKPELIEEAKKVLELAKKFI